jgi:hypothetical protein
LRRSLRRFVTQLWTDNGISALDAEKLRLAYGVKSAK